MKLISGKESINEEPVAATIGFFDGVHLGHRLLIDQVKAIAEQRRIRSAVVTFAVHPRKVVQPDYAPKLLTTTDERIRLLEQSGVDFCVVLDFDASLAQLSAQQFIETVLRNRLSAEALIIGYDHRFGKNRMENFDDYVRYGNAIGITTLKAKALQIDGVNVSSSVIREQILRGEIANANNLLGYAYSVSGVVVEGQRIGRTIGFPTANIQPLDSAKLVPANGVYAIRLLVDNCWHQGMLNIGLRPTIGDGLQRTIEANLFDFEGDLYGKTVTVEFIGKLRDERKMSGLAELKAQLKTDQENAREYLSKKG